MKKNDAWKETEEIFLPRQGRQAENHRFVGVNGRYFQVPLGTVTRVPRPVYDALQDARRGEEEAEKYLETILRRN